MEGLSDRCKTYLVNNVLNTRDKVHLMTVLNTDAKAFSHFLTYNKFKNTKPTIREWAEEWFWSLDYRPNTSNYYIDCHHSGPYYLWEIEERVEKVWEIEERVEKELKIIYVRIEKGMCYAQIGPFEIGLEPEEIRLEIEVPVEIKPEDTIPNINSVDDYMNIVAPHCEALLELLLKIHNNNKITH